MNQQQFKPFAIGDRVISEAEGPGTVKAICKEYHFSVIVLFDNNSEDNFSQTGSFGRYGYPQFDIRHMTAEEMEQFPKPE